MPKRIKRERTKGWTLAGATDNPNGAVIVDRSSRYGNPFVVNREFAVQAPEGEPYNGRQWTCSTNAAARGWAARLFADWLNGTGPDVYQLNGRTYDRRRILAAIDAGVLTGRDLACTCPLPVQLGQPDHCHATPLMQRANRGEA